MMRLTLAITLLGLCLHGPSAHADVISSLIALKNHVLSSPALTGPEIGAHMATIETDQALIGTGGDVMSAAFDLVDTYDAQISPLWSSSSSVKEFNRGSVSNQDIHWVVYNVMQHLMDYAYTSANLTTHAALLDGKLFGCSARFPGAVAAPSAVVTHTATINASYPETDGHLLLFDDLPARKPTGTYVAPGTIVTVKVPASIVGKGYQVRVGAHSWDFEEEGRPRILRLDRSTIAYDINSTEIEVGSPIGGGIYIEVPYLANEGVVSVEITGAVRSPFYSHNTVTGHITTLSEWQNTERLHPAPWADFQTERCLIQVPTDWIYKLDDPITTMAEWDSCIDSVNDLMGFPRARGKETMYMQVDLQIRFSAYAPGYPMANDIYNPNTDHKGLANHYLVSGPRNAPYWVFHELGHGYLFKKFGFESESHVNLLHVAAWNQGLGIDLDTAFRMSAVNSSITFRTLDRTAVEWMTSFNFSPLDKKMSSYEKNYRLKGHAKYVDMARLFGWQAVYDFHHQLVLDGVGNLDPSVSDDDLIVRLAVAAGVDLRPLLHFWGVHPRYPETVANAIAAAGLGVSNEIYDQIWYYRSQIPADNAAFQNFVTQWWNGPPNINGSFTEGQHARQWDSTELWDQGEDSDRAPLLPNGEIYDESSHDRVTARVDTILALYFPDGDPVPDTDPPTPNAAQFLEAPAANSPSAISMTAVTGTDVTGRVEYLFTETSGNPGGTSSGWQSSSCYTDTGLNASTEYSYTVTMRDSLGNTGSPSAPASATTDPPDMAPPTPNPMTWASVPAAGGGSSITMTATTATDPSGVEYYFTETSGNPGGSDSGWQDSPSYTDTGLSYNTTYSYTVTARDKTATQNEGDPSTPALPATTGGKGTATITWTAFNITNDVTNISTHGTLVSARNGTATTAVTVNGVTFQGADTSGDLFNSLFNNDNIGNRGSGSVVTDTSYQNLLKSGQRSGRLGYNTPPRTEPTEVWATVEFTGLAAGNTYEIQVWASDVSTTLDGKQQTKALVLGNGSASAPELTDTQLFYEVVDGGAGQYGTGTFVANATNQSFNVRTRVNLDATPAWGSSDHFSNGMQIRDLGVVAGPSYSGWANDTGNVFLGTLSDPSADIDFDAGGLATGIEWVVGGDPTDPSDDSGLAPTAREDATYLIFTYIRSDAANADPNTAIKVEYSTDMQGWDDAQDGVNGVSIAVTPGDLSDSVEVSIPKTRAAPGSKLFARFNVVVTTP